MAGWFSVSPKPKKANSLYSALACGAGIFGLGNNKHEGMPWCRNIEPAGNEIVS
jgi:hypothetical protein